MSFTKKVVKETTTPAQVEQIIVTERGTDELKRINKADIVANVSANVPGAKYWIGIVTQSSTNPPTATVYKNELGGDIVWSYDAVGRYTGTLAGAFPIGTTALSVSRTGDDGNFTGSSTLLASGFNDADSFYINSGRIAPATGVITLTNGYLYNTLITIVALDDATSL